MGRTRGRSDGGHAEKLSLLNQAAEIEAADAFAPSGAGGKACDLTPSISHVCAPGGRRVPVLKVLQNSACRNNCRYCAFRAGRDVRRAHLTPDELARSVDLMYRAGLIEGIFLSSGIGDTCKTMDEMLATAELLRGRYAFPGYLHLKLLPGCEAAQVAHAVALADRVSANLEAPAGERLAFLAPDKHMAELVGPLRAAAAAIRQQRAAERGPDPGAAAQGAGVDGLQGGGAGGTNRGAGAAPYAGRARLGLSTQFVVGPAGESDRELLSTAAWLYREVRLARAYYSPFRPVADTPLEDAPAHRRAAWAPPVSGRLAAALLRFWHRGAAF